MPFSMDEGKDWMLDRIQKDAPDSVLDLGPGAGTYAKLLRPILPTARFSCVEVFEPYVARFGLERLYDKIIVGDARQIALPIADVIILGDMLEHMPESDALELWRRAREAAKVAVYLSIPIVEYAQGSWEGNPFEAHLQTWSDQSVRSLLAGITEYATFSILGVYRADGIADG